MIIDQFVVFWPTVTFHQQNLSTDKCAIWANLILKVGEWGRQMPISDHILPMSDRILPMSDHRFLPSKALLLRDMVVKH
jgi:hypothetical protein